MCPTVLLPPVRLPTWLLSHQVCGVLESLEQEYRREEDWCGGGDRQPEQLMPLINKHMEQKEAFLKVRRFPDLLTHTWSQATARGR